MPIFIGGAWPYANGSLHIGHVAGLLAGDILARYFRLKGEEVLYVSGSDCHGTPIAIRARQEGVDAQVISERYHQEFKACFQKLGFSYDLYGRTDAEFHKKAVQALFKRIWQNGYLYEKTVKQLYCPQCEQFLPDRYVEGICPYCGQPARGDQCDHCTALINPLELEHKKCKLCGGTPIVRETTHLYFALSRFQAQLEARLAKQEGWRANAVKLTERYLQEGLRDRAATRDVAVGIKTPIPGFEEKRIYVWMEAVCGYLTASQLWAEKTGKDWRRFWQGSAITAYYVHGKDNVPFHTLIWPAILLAEGTLHLPDRIIASEYLTLERQKISTSKNWAVWLPDIIERYHPDTIRYFLTINGPENRDADFSWREFVHSHNGELLGAFANFVNRNLAFIKKSFANRIPRGQMDETMRSCLLDLYHNVGEKIELGCFKESLEAIFTFIRQANKYFDTKQPWLQIKNDIAGCGDTLYTCVQIIANLANLLAPFIPFGCEKIRAFLQLEKLTWQYTTVLAGQELADIDILYERIDKKQIQEEQRRLVQHKS